MKIKFIAVALIALLYSGASWAQLITYQFEGSFRDISNLFTVGDSFQGSYTFESAAPVIPHPDITLATQSQAINAGLAGTGWNIDVFSSVVPDFSLSGNNGVIAIGNDGVFGDRYTTTLNFSTPLPLGLSLAFFQIDLQDLFAGPADMLSDDSFSTLPMLSLAQHAGGRFFVLGNTGGCQQCQIEITSLTAMSLAPSPVPVPAAVWLFGSALIGVLGIGRRRKTIHQAAVQRH